MYKKLYCNLKQMLAVATLADEEYPSIYLSQDELKILIKLLGEKLKDEEAYRKDIKQL